MLNIGLQFFAHKKGVGSTRNAAIYFSRWKDTTPLPPLPDLTVMRAVSTKGAAIAVLLLSGRVKFERLGKDRKQVSIVEIAE